MRPSFASADARRSAIVRTVVAATSSGDFHATSRDQPLGDARPPRARGEKRGRLPRSPAAARSSAGTTWWTSPIRWASRASNRSPVRKRSRAVPRPDRPQDEGRDDRRQNPEPDLGEREDRALGRDRDVRGRDEPDASADRGPVRERDHRLRARVDRPEHPRHPLGVGLVLRLRVAAGLAHPVHVGARRRTSARRPRGRRRGCRSRSPACRERPRQLLDENVVERVAHVRAGERDREWHGAVRREAEVPVRGPRRSRTARQLPGEIERHDHVAALQPQDDLALQPDRDLASGDQRLAGGGDERRVVDRRWAGVSVFLRPPRRIRPRAEPSPDGLPLGEEDVRASRRSARRSRAG